ncbi:MAG TPA: PAS domain-containing protein [Polyangiaceae bacterium]
MAGERDKVIGIGTQAARKLVPVPPDGTAARERDASLLQEHELLVMALDQLPVVFFATDAAGVIRIARGKGAVRLGKGAVGRSAFELFADVPSVQQNLRRALAGEAVTTEGESDEVWWETRYMPLRGPGGEVTGVVGVTMDATTRKRAEQDLVKANARLTVLDALVEQQHQLHYALESARAAREEAEHAGQANGAFLRMLADEVRGPLAAIAHEAGGIARDGLPHAVRAGVDRIVAASTKLADVVHSLLGYVDVKGAAADAKGAAADGKDGAGPAKHGAGRAKDGTGP